MTTAVTSYKLNADNARTVGTSQAIREKGAYSGKFIRAEAVVSDKGTNGLELAFLCDNGQTSDYLTLWTTNADGGPLYGRKVLDALMTAMKVREVNIETGIVKKRNPETGREEDVRAPIFPGLMNKPIGLFLVREEYLKQDNTVGAKMTIVGAYEPATKKLPAEILDNKPAELFDRVLASLQDRPLKQRPRSTARVSNSNGRNADPESMGGGFDEMDDDIPF